MCSLQGNYDVIRNWERFETGPLTVYQKMSCYFTFFKISCISVHEPCFHPSNSAAFGHKPQLWDRPTQIPKPVHEISNNVVCATSKSSDQPVHMRSLINAFASRLSIL